MTTQIDTVQLITDMEKVAAQLTQLIADMKGAAAQVLAGKVSIKDIELSEKSESEQIEFVPATMSVSMSVAAAMPPTHAMSFSSIDISKIVSDIKSAGIHILGKDIPTITGFSENQLTELAKQAKRVAQGIVDGEITEATREFFLKGLKEMAGNFVRTLKDIVDVLIEKLLNAVISILREAIETAIGFKLPSFY